MEVVVRRGRRKRRSEEEERDDADPLLSDWIREGMRKQ